MLRDGDQGFGRGAADVDVLWCKQFCVCGGAVLTPKSYFFTPKCVPAIGGAVINPPNSPLPHLGLLAVGVDRLHVEEDGFHFTP